MKFKLIASICIGVLPQLAYADDNFDIAPTIECLSDAVSIHDQSACVGKAAEVCADASVGGFSTRSMTGCLQHEFVYFDQLLNTEFQSVRTRAIELDEVDSGTSGDEVSMLDRLVQMQRAWITYRDATCAYERRQYDGGTIGGLIEVDCQTQLTAQQAFRLQSSVLGL